MLVKLVLFMGLVASPALGTAVKPLARNEQLPVSPLQSAISRAEDQKATTVELQVKASELTSPQGADEQTEKTPQPQQQQSEKTEEPAKKAPIEQQQQVQEASKIQPQTTKAELPVKQTEQQNEEKFEQQQQEEQQEEAPVLQLEENVKPVQIEQQTQIQDAEKGVQFRAVDATRQEPSKASIGKLNETKGGPPTLGASRKEPSVKQAPYTSNRQQPPIAPQSPIAAHGSYLKAKLLSLFPQVEYVNGDPAPQRDYYRSPYASSYPYFGFGFGFPSVTYSQQPMPQQKLSTELGGKLAQQERQTQLPQYGSYYNYYNNLQQPTYPANGGYYAGDASYYPQRASYFSRLFGFARPLPMYSYTDGSVQAPEYTNNGQY